MNALECIQNLRAGREVDRSRAALYEFVRATLLKNLHDPLGGRVQPRLDAEDVVQEATLRVFEALDGFQGSSEASFSSWVATIARNFIADQARRRSAAALRLVEESQTGASGPGSPGLAYDAHDQSELARRDWIETTLACLKPKEAEVIRLHRLDGKSIAEIARAWQKSDEAVKRFYTRSWERFREAATRARRREGE